MALRGVEFSWGSNMFDSRYEVYLADTAESRLMHHRVRFQVFCVEHGFESVEANRNLQEVDDWDSRARHFVVQEKQSGAAVAGVRIVLPDAGDLPVEQLRCITERTPVDVGREQLGEISRIGVVRKLDSSEKGAIFPNNRATALQAVDRGDESEVLLGLIRAIIRYSWDSDIGYLYMLVTRPFARLLKRLGVVCTQMGNEVDHRGLRAPYFIDVNASWRGLVARSGSVAELFSRHHLAYFSHAQTQSLRVGAAQTVNTQSLAMAAA